MKIVIGYGVRGTQYRNYKALEIADTVFLKPTMKDRPTLDKTILSIHVPSQSDFRLQCGT